MSRLIEREDWPPDPRPGSIIYFCGPLQDGPDLADQARAPERVRSIARDWLSRYSGHPWPDVSSNGALDFHQLYRREGGNAEQRFGAQYFRANVSGSARYVQTVPGSTDHRIRPGESGFDNLYLAGDWVRTDLNAGCVEAAAMGGLAASAAISGRRIEIVDGERRPLAATLTEHALNAVNGIARSEAAIIVVSVEAELARRLLPPGLELAPQRITSPGGCPVLLMFGRLRDARMNIAPIGINYHEFVLMLPSVREIRPTSTLETGAPVCLYAATLSRQPGDAADRPRRLRLSEGSGQG
jgi:hypothetical protein